MTVSAVSIAFPTVSGSSASQTSAAGSAGDLCVCIVASANTGNVVPTMNTGGWTYLGASPGSTANAYGVDSGLRRVDVWYKIAAGTSGEAASVTTGGTTPQTIYVANARFAKTLAAWKVPQFAADSNATTNSAPTFTFTGLSSVSTGAFVILGLHSVPRANNTTWGTTAWTGATFGSFTENDLTTTNGNDARFNYMAREITAASGTSGDLSQPVTITGGGYGAAVAVILEDEDGSAADLSATAGLSATADLTVAGSANAPVTADLTATGDVTTSGVTLSGDADLAVSAGLTASPPIIGTATSNRAGGIRLSGTFPLEFDPAVEPLPTGLVLGERVIAATAFGDVTVTGTVAAYDHTTVSKYRRRTRIVIGGKDVTTWRGVETQVTYQYVAPLLYGPATVTLPQANLAFERPGHDALKWLKKFATVKVQRLNSEGEVTSTDYRGFVVALDTDGSGITVQVGGEASGRAALRWKQLPVFQSRIGVERLAFRAIREMGLRFKPRLGGANTGVTLGRFGGTGQLDYLSQLCAHAQRKDGTLFSIMPDDDGDYRMEAKDTTTIHATVYIDGTRVKGNLRSDAAEEPNRIFATAVTPNGERLTGRTAPGLQQADPPPPFPGHMEEGDTGPGVDLLLTGLMMTDLLDRTDSPGGYDDDVVEAVQDLQNEAGLSETGEVNEATWNALWNLDVTGFSLDWATRQPAAQKDEVKKWKRTPSGAIIRANLDYDARVPKVDLDVDMGAGVTRRQRKRYARGELQQSQSDNWVGTIEVTTGAVIEGEHNPGDPLTEADLMDVRDVKPGMNIWAPTFDGGTLFHVSGSDPLAGTLMVDTRARDTLKVWEIIQRNRETRSNPARAWERAHRASGELKDSVIEWDGIGGQLGSPVEVPANTWVVFPVVAGQEGTVSRLRLNTSPNAEFVCAVFGRSIRAKRLEMIIGNPLTEAGYDQWTDEDKRDRLDGRILLYTAGAWDNPCGYFPKSKLRPDGEESGADLTGKWYDEAGFAFRTFKYPVLYVAVYADRDTEIPAGQVMWPLLEPGA